MLIETFLQNLPDSSQRLGVIINVFNDLLFILDSDGTILDYKAGDSSHLHIPPEKFLRRKMQDVLPPEAGNKIADAIRDIDAGIDPALVEYFLHTPSGKCWYESRFIRHGNGQIFMIARDITKYKKLEFKIKSRVEDSRKGEYRKDKRFSSADVLENEITHLLASMYDYKEARADEAEKQIIENWRANLAVIRRALQNISGE